MSLKKLVFAAGLGLVLGSPAPAAEPPPLSVQVIVDQSALLQKPAEASKFQKRLLHHLTELRKRRGTENAEIRIVSVNDPRNLWVGSPRDLFHGRALLPLLDVVDNGCADLAGAFEQVRTNLRLRPGAEVRVYVFSSLIHTGAPCDRSEINLPQPPPAGLDLTFLAETARALKFYWVHPLQEEPWTDFLEKQGFLERQRRGQLAFALHDEASTAKYLNEGL